MKNYKDFEKVFIGDSDIASLILVGWSENGLKLFDLHFGEDGSYQAYIIDEDTEIPKHYSRVYECKSWLRIYDDIGLVKEFDSNLIEIYRAGEMGCIIKLI